VFGAMAFAKARTNPYGRVASPVWLVSLVLAATVLGPPNLSAQQPDTARADSVPLYRLEGITVTVSRSRDEVQRLPYAIGVLGAPEIQTLQATVSLDEALPQIPGVFVNNRYNLANGDRISIRGFGARSQFGVRGVRIIQDGIPLTLPDGQSQLNNLDLAAAGRIEVIRGPASALYGNASGGVISVQTESAPPGPLGGEIRWLGGSFGDDRTYQKYDLKAAGRPGRADYYAHLAHFQTDGYRLHSAARYTLFNGRFGYRPDSVSDLTIAVNYADTPLAENPSSLTDSLARAKPDTARDIALSPEQCPPDPGLAGCQDLGEESRQGQLGINYRRRLGAEHQLSLMAYGLVRRLENRIPFTLIELDRRAGGARLEYRYAPLTGRITGLTGGIDLDRQADDRLETARDADQTGPATLDQDERVAALGLFAQGGVELYADLELTLSLRYDRVTFAVDDRLIAGDDPDDSGRRHMDQLSPMAGLRYSLAPSLNVYANIGRSFQTPTTTELTDSLGGFNESLQPERAINYELGLKGTVSERLSYDLAIFRTDVDGLIVGSAVPGTERVFFENAGATDLRGAELGVSALIVEGLVFTAAYTHSDFVFRDFRSDDNEFSGNRLPGVPPNQASGSLTYSHRSGVTGALQVWGVDDYYVDNSNENRNEGYVTTNIRIGYSLRTPSLEILPVLGVNDIFDVRYNSSVVVNAVARAFYEPAPGRYFYAGLRVKTR